jgi:osmotically-inducible protein OsmY
MTKNLATVALLVLGGLGSATALADGDNSFEGAAKDAWLTGRVETMYLLNVHLNSFAINTDVEGGVVHLSGAVESDIDRDLAIELARGISGVTEVRSDLLVDGQASHRTATNADPEHRGFGSWVDDATTTAVVKSKLIGNANTKGLKIDVDTEDDVVTLSGRVQTSEEKALAAEIARNSRDVEDVRNNLVVDPS